MFVPRWLAALAIALSAPAPLLADLPLPDLTLYGKITGPTGAPVSSGALEARVRRTWASTLGVPGAFIQADGVAWYIVRVPLETAIGAPGPSGAGAREGDVIESLILDGNPLELGTAPPVLGAGLVSRIDATTNSAPGRRYFRGDCSPDLTLNITDPLRLLNFLFIAPGAPPCLEACDGDGNGTLNITDAVYLLSHLFLGGPRPPEPGPQCGLDPSPSNLGCVQTNCV